MFDFLQNFNSRPRPEINRKHFWISTSNTPEERTKVKHVRKLKNIFIDTSLADANTISTDYKRGVIFLKKYRVAEWKSEKMCIDPVKLKESGIDVEAARIDDAMREMLQE